MKFAQFYTAPSDKSIERRRKMAEQMMADASKDHPTEMVSGFAVPQSGLSALANALKMGVAGYYGGQADHDEELRAENARQTMSDAIHAYTQSQAGGSSTFNDGTKVNWNTMDPDKANSMYAEILMGNEDTAPYGMQSIMSNMQAKQEMAQQIALLEKKKQLGLGADGSTPASMQVADQLFKYAQIAVDPTKSEEERKRAQFQYNLLGQASKSYGWDRGLNQDLMGGGGPPPITDLNNPVGQPTGYPTAPMNVTGPQGQPAYPGLNEQGDQDYIYNPQGSALPAPNGALPRPALTGQAVPPVLPPQAGMVPQLPVPSPSIGVAPGFIEAKSAIEGSVSRAKEDQKNISDQNYAEEIEKRKAVGKAAGETEGAYNKKELQSEDNALVIEKILTKDESGRDLLDKATGSGAGALLAAGKGFLGQSDESTQANAQLSIYGGQLLNNVPRMEGPQSNADMDTYKEQAGKIANPRIPGADKRAALAAVMQIREKYAALNAKTNGGLKPGQVVNGHTYLGGNPNDPSSWR